MLFRVLLALTFLSIGFSGARSLAQEFVKGDVIIKLKGQASAQSARQFMSKAGSEKGLQHKGSWSSLNLHHYSLKAGEDTLAAIEKLKNDPAVEYVEPNYLLKKATAMTGADAGAVRVLSDGEVSSLASAGTFAMTSAPIHATDVWTSLTGSDRPIVAVIDTGVALTHSKLQNALWTNPGEVPNNGADDDGNGYVDDVYGWNFVENNNNPNDCDGHGTHVAGIIRGTGQDIMVTPVPSPIIQIMALRFLDCEGSGATSDAIKAIYYAVNNGARVLNNSWGGPGYSRSLQEAILYSYNHKTVFVAAAGNSSNNNDASPVYPAAYDVPNVVAVAATRDSDDMASFSNYGPRTTPLAAPGVFITSTYLNNAFAQLSGTSMAAPFVSGTLSLMAHERPEMSGYQMKTLLTANVDVNTAKLSGKVGTSGRLNALKSVQSSQGATINNSQPTYDIMASPQDRELASNLASGGGCGTVAKLYQEIGNNGRNGPPRGLVGLVFGALFILPLVVMAALRRRDPAGQRRHERFVMNSTVSLKVGDEELEGAIETISLGGVGLNSNALIEQGSVVTMCIESPDGKGQKIEVQGRVVWSKSQEKYGLQFVDADRATKSVIKGWTKTLVKAG